VLQCVAVCCSVLQCISVCCSVCGVNLEDKMCCSVLQYVLQCVAVSTVRCRLREHMKMILRDEDDFAGTHCGYCNTLMLQHAATSLWILQHTATHHCGYCNTLQHITVDTATHCNTCVAVSTVRCRFVQWYYGVAMIRRIDKITGLFCSISSLS